MRNVDAQIVTDVLDCVPGGILAVDSDKRILYLNRDFDCMFHVEAADWIQRPLSELVEHIKSEFRAVQGGFADAAARPDARESRELVLAADHGVIFLREDSAPLQDADGAPAGRAYVYRDVSREKAIDRMKSEFIGTASHELRTPMTSIKGAIDLVLSGFAGDVSLETRELLAIGQKNCERLIRLINEILDITKIEAGKIQLKLEAIDPTIPVEDAMHAVASFAAQHGIRIAIEGSGSCPPAVLDKDRIEQVVINLLSNAIKFSPENGEIRVRAICDGPWFQCSVIDQGCGISEADLARVFGKFQQFGESSRMEGSGLGLAIAKGLVGEHGGEIWVESEAGRGSCFSFRIPMGGPEHTAERASARR
jgi:signal transduction histidine kinase